MTATQGAKDDQQRQQQLFERCHLQILRSLYKDDDGSSSSSRENGSDNNERDNTNGNETDDKAIDSEAEGPVGSEIWELIDKFLQQRKEYLPQLKQQIHWNEIFAEASSRRDHFISTSSEEQQQQQASLFRAPSLTPRNLAFSAVKRRSLSTPNSHMNLSLTPLTSNRNTMSNINSHELSEVTIPSWNFISRMVQQRQDTCTKSCDAFRSEPFLQSLLDEAKARCKVLEVSLQALKKKNELEADIDHNRNKRGSTTPSSPEAKRVKFDNFEDKCVTGISFFKRSEPIPKPFDHDECSQAKYSDSIMQTQIKLNLWLSLSKSVEKIIDVGNK
eukprot:scaffold1362_cov103-Skeletonema_dohrnii-CCMP3373.AAC.2